MKEKEWLKSKWPDSLIDFIRRRASKRKLRLYACACCRRVIKHMSDPRSRQTIEVSERFADGLASEEELRAAHREATAAASAVRRRLGLGAQADPFMQTEAGQQWQAARAALRLVTGREALGAAAEAWAAGGVTWAQRDVARRAQTALVREVFGNPFRPITVSPAVLAWDGGRVVELAEAAYEQRDLPAGTLDNTRLAVLADALEEAGCTEPLLLDHCRQPAEHVRGCWVVDLLTGRE